MKATIINKELTLLQTCINLVNRIPSTDGTWLQRFKDRCTIRLLIFKMDVYNRAIHAVCPVSLKDWGKDTLKLLNIINRVLDSMCVS